MRAREQRDAKPERRPLGRRQARPANMPTMKMSGCAKLMTRSTVKASAKPIATTA